MDGKGDIIDQGNEAAEIFRRSALSQRAPAGPAPTGHCHNCGEAVSAERRWCDSHCRDDWEKTQRAAALAPREPDPE